MSDVFYLRPIRPPIVPKDVETMAQHAGGCFDLHRVDWKHSFLAADGGRMLCWYGAPDAESARLALRQLGSDMNAVWTGNVIGGESASSALTQAGVVAEITLDKRLPDDELGRVAVALQRQEPKLVGGFVSARGTKVVLLFAGNDVRGAETALAAAGLPAESAWACVPVAPFAGRSV